MAETKRCTKCGQDKPQTAFPRDKKSPSGRTSRCCACNAAYLVEYHKRCTPPSMTPEAIAERTRAWRAAHAGARRAHKCVEVALASGMLQRQPCELCGAATADAHHPDYSKPLAVVWLCRSCHHRVHSEESAIGVTRRAPGKPKQRARPWREAIRRSIKERHAAGREP